MQEIESSFWGFPTLYKTSCPLATSPGTLHSVDSSWMPKGKPQKGICAPVIRHSCRSSVGWFRFELSTCSARSRKLHVQGLTMPAWARRCLFPQRPYVAQAYVLQPSRSHVPTRGCLAQLSTFTSVDTCQYSSFGASFARQPQRPCIRFAGLSRITGPTAHKRSSCTSVTSGGIFNWVQELSRRINNVGWLVYAPASLAHGLGGSNRIPLLRVILCASVRIVSSLESAAGSVKRSKQYVGALAIDLHLFP